MTTQTKQPTFSALFSELKQRLIQQRQSPKYFTKKTLEIMLKDKQEAKRRFNLGENVNAAGGFWSNSDTQKTDFYNKNSCAYCVLLEILLDYDFWRF